MYSASAVACLLVSALCLCASVVSTWCTVGNGFFWFGMEPPYHVQAGILFVHAQFVGGRESGQGATGLMAHFFGEGKTASASKFHNMNGWSDFTRRACSWDPPARGGGGLLGGLVAVANHMEDWQHRTCEDVQWARMLTWFSAACIGGGVICSVLGVQAIMSKNKGTPLITFPAAVMGFCAMILIAQSSVAYMIVDIFGGGWVTFFSPGTFFTVVAAMAAFFGMMLNYQEYDEDFGISGPPPLYSNVYGTQAQYHYGAAPTYGRAPPPVGYYTPEYDSDAMDPGVGCFCIGLAAVVLFGTMIMFTTGMMTGPEYYY